MSSDHSPAAAPAADGELLARLDMPLPRSLPRARPTSVFCIGTCFHPGQAIESLELLIAGRRHRIAAFGMPRPDVWTLHRADPEVAQRAYRSGFWTTAPVEAAANGTVEVGVEARFAGGGRDAVALGSIDLDDPAPAAGPPPGRETDDLIAICMGTFNPDPELFRRQITSLRRQEHANWVCLVSDDHSDPERHEQILEVLGGDERFIVSRADRRLGFYRNFERALRMAPTEAPFLALCDQDDNWYPDKLTTLLRELGDAELAYSDQRLVDADGTVISDTFWRGRRNNHTSLASLLFANSVTGAAALFRREVAEAALPFPDQPGWQFHDHWIALVALSRGRLVYVDRPLYDYVQHPGAILGQVAVEPEAEGRRHGRRFGRERIRAALRGSRAVYFCGYVRLKVQAETLLLRCLPQLSPRKRRTLQRFTRAESSPLALLWLAGRPLRAIAGRSETLGAERQLVRGILWRRSIGPLASRGAPPASPRDASMPACTPESFGQKRLRRWRARLGR